MSNLNIDDFADIALPIHTMSLIQLQASTTINTMAIQTTMRCMLFPLIILLSWPAV